MSKILLIFCALGTVAVAATVTLKNDTTSDASMEARGNASVVRGVVPASSEVTVEVGQGIFELEDFAKGFGMGFLITAPFALVGFMRKVFREAE